MYTRPLWAALYDEQHAQATNPVLSAGTTWSGFAARYQHLCALPRRVRRALQRQSKQSLADGEGDTVALCDIGAFELDPPLPTELAHDLAVTHIIAPKVVTLTPTKPTQTKTVKVQVQNRSLHPETIPDLTVLSNLVSLNVFSLGACTAPGPVLVPPTKLFPLTLKSKQKLIVTFEVTFDCANDSAKSTAKDHGHDDFVYSATVDHSALPGGVADDHPADDNCPRASLGIVPYPDGKLKDKGCAEDVTDMAMK